MRPRTSSKRNRKKKPIQTIVEHPNVEKNEKRLVTKTSQIQCYDPKNIDAKIQAARNSIDQNQIMTVFVYPQEIYNGSTIKGCAISWVSIHGIDDEKNANNFAKKTIELFYSQSKGVVFKNIYKELRGDFMNLSEFIMDCSKIRTALVTNNDYVNTTSTTEILIDDGPKIVRGLSLETYVKMYPAVEHLSVLSEKWIKEKKKLKERYIMLYQESNDSFYTLFVKNKKEDVAIIRYINLENCHRIKQGKVENNSTIELYVNELIFVIIAQNNKDHNSWLEKLCAATGTDLDVQNTSTKINFIKLNSSGDENNAWRTDDLPELEKYSIFNDKEFIKKFLPDRLSVFSVYPDSIKYYKPDKDNRSNLKTTKRYVKINIDSLQFGLTLNHAKEKFAVEPYVIKCYLFDSQSEQKLTEDIYFDVNQESLINLRNFHNLFSVNECIKIAKSNIPLERITAALFPFYQTGKRIFAIFTILKIHDDRHPFDPYIKPDSKQAQRQHLKISVLANSKLIYYTKLAFSYISFQSSDKLLDDLNLPLYRYDSKISDLSKFVVEISGETKKQSALVLPGCSVLGKIIVDDDIDINDQYLSSSYEPKCYDNSKSPTKNSENKKNKNKLFLEVGNYQNSYDNVNYYEPTFNSNLILVLKSLNLSNFKLALKLKFLSVKVEVKEGYEGKNLPIIYSQIGSVCYVDSITCPVVYRNELVMFDHEIKILLPNKINEETHICFTFLNINTKYIFVENKKKKQSLNVIGYTWFPLNKINEYTSNKHHSLPVFVSVPSKHLDLNLKKELKSQDLRFIEGQGKNIFDFYVRNMCNSHTFVQPFEELLDIFDKKDIKNENYERVIKLIKVCHCFENVSLNNSYDTIIQYLFDILNSLPTYKLKEAVYNELTKAVVSLMMNLIRDISIKSKNYRLNQFIDDYSIVKRKNSYVHVVLLKGLKEYITIDPKSLVPTFRNSEFLFKIILKCLKLAVHTKDNIVKGNGQNPHYENLAWFVEANMIYIESVAHDDFFKGKECIYLHTHFLCDLMNLIDKNLAIYLLSFTYEFFKQRDKKKQLCELKFDFLSNVIKHEFFIIINIPLAIPLKFTQFGNMSKMYTSQRFVEDHYLLAIIFEELQKSFYDSPHTFSHAVSLIKRILIKINFDSRYRDQGVLGHLLCLFVPFVTILVENAQILKDMWANKKENVTKFKRNSTLQTGTLKKSSVSRSSIAEEVPSEVDLSQNQIRELFISFLFVLQKINPLYLQIWWSILPQMNLKIPVSVQNNFTSLYGENCTVKQSYVVNFFILLQLSLEIFKFGNTVQKKNELILESLSGNTNFGLSLGNRRKTTMKLQDELLNVECVLSEEIIILVLSLIEQFNETQKLTLKANGGNNAVSKIVFDIMNNLITIEKSKYVDLILLSHFRLYFQSNLYIMFRGCNDFLEKLYISLFSKLPLIEQPVREEITNTIFLIMKANYFFSGVPFQRSYIKLIVASTHVMNNSITTKYVMKSLNTWLRFIKYDKATKGSEFVNEVLDLCSRVQSILKVGKLLAAHKDNMEMSVDILYNLANSFSETPELLINWQQRMIDTHCQNKYFSEAAMCSLHSAAIIVQLLKHSEKSLKDGLSIYRQISHNIIEYNFVAKKDEIIDSNLNYMNLYTFLLNSSGYFIKAERFESVSALFKCILPILEEKKNYLELANVHKQLSESYEKISEPTLASRRTFGSYFRVAFIGKGFIDDNGKNYIYKEPPFTPLATMSERLERIYEKKVSNLKIVLETGKLKVKQLKVTDNYIQINSVKTYEDYFREYSGLSEFDKNTNVKLFVMEAPFTLSGNARGEIHEQCKRITTFHTYHAFPYIKKRINIIYKKIKNLTPIEVAIGEMKTQVNDLQTITSIVPPDMKRLQLKLQGSVSCQVNAGPLAYAKTFLNKDDIAKYDKKYTEALSDAFVDFINACEVALQLNSELVQADQMAYHGDLCEKFNELKKELLTFVSSKMLEAPTAEAVINL